MSDIEDDSDFLSDGGSSTEDEVEDMLLNEPRVKNSNYLEETVPEYSEDVCFEHFRIQRRVVNDIVGKYEGSQYYHKSKGPFENIPALHQILIFLWYIGHQTVSFRDVADRFDVSISSVHRLLKRVTLFLSNLSPDVILWPTNNDKRVIEQHFRENGFPNIIGAIDGCHIKIDKPENDPDSYINRKGYYSTQIQVVCDHRRKIVDLYVGYPGSVHDSRVFRNSPLGNNLEERCGRYYLLADSGYPLKPNMLTPYKDRGNLTRVQRNYNVLLSKNHYVIEHCFGVLKQKFRQLFHIKLRNIKHVVHIIRAACVLHNIALEDDFSVVGDIPPDYMAPIPGPAENEEPEEEEDDVDACAIRDQIARSIHTGHRR